MGSVFHLDSFPEICLPFALPNSLLGETANKISKGAEFVGIVQLFRRFFERLLGLCEAGALGIGLDADESLYGLEVY